MNVIELNQGTYGTLAHYVAATLPLTVVTIWVVVAFQNSFTVPAAGNTWTRLLWPIFILRALFHQPRRPDNGRKSSIIPF